MTSENSNHQPGHWLSRKESEVEAVGKGGPIPWKVRGMSVSGAYGRQLAHVRPAAGTVWFSVGKFLVRFVAGTTHNTQYFYLYLHQNGVGAPFP